MPDERHENCREPDVMSPCVAVCTLDASGQLCIGCYRTLDEIADWSQLSVPQRRAVLDSAEQRKKRTSADSAVDP